MQVSESGKKLANFRIFPKIFVAKIESTNGIVSCEVSRKKTSTHELVI